MYTDDLDDIGIFGQAEGKGCAPDSFVINHKKFCLDPNRPGYADLVYSWTNGRYCGDFNRTDHWLYRTRKDNWLLVGEGGPLTGYAQPSGNNGRSGGWRAQHISKDRARQILEGQQQLELVEEIFGEIETA